MKKKNKLIITVIAIVIIGLIAVRLISFIQTASNNGADTEQSYIPVNAQTVQKGTIDTTVTLTGKVQPEQEVYIVPRTPGTVISLSAHIGDTVTKDQVLFTLDQSDLENSYDQSMASLKAAEANYRSVKEQHDKAVTDLARYQELYDNGAISASELEQAKLLASDNSLLAAQAQLEQAQAGFNAASDTINDMEVKSPISGIVTALSVEVGDTATSASPAVTIVNMDQVYINISVSENIINSIQNGQHVTVNIPSATNDNLKGTIADLSLAADAATGKYAMKIYIDNPDHLLKSGMFAQVKLTTDSKSDVITVPTDAIVYHNGEYVAYVVENDKAIEKTVTTGMDNGQEIEVVSGLSPGDILIIEGQSYVNDGSTVKIIELDGQTANDTEGDN